MLCATPEVAQHPGALIITKFTDEADEIADKINTKAGSIIALAVHGKAHPMTATAMTEIPVLIITHEAYRSALRETHDRPDTANRLALFHGYHQASRSWIIIDEAFNWIDTYEVDLDDAYGMCAALSVQLPRNANLDTLSVFIRQLAIGHTANRSDKLLSDLEFAVLADVDFEQLRAAIKEAPTDTIELWRNAGLHLRSSHATGAHTEIRHTTFKNEYLSLLTSLETIKRIGRCWISQRRARTRLHSSRLMLDTDRPCGVILDATASIDRTYEMLGNRVAIIPRPPHLRSYKNVTVYVSRPHPVGKEYLGKHAATQWPSLIKHLSAKLSDQSKALVITQKGTKEIIADKLPRSVTHTGHWGDLDGKNKWRDCDAVLIYGLPYPDDIMPTDAFHACTGQWSPAWFEGQREYFGHADTKTAFKYGYIARSVIQAINRVHCRTIIDDEGNCAQTSVFILLPRGEAGDTILAAIRSEMPGAHTVQWNALPEDRPTLTRNERRALSELQILLPGNICTKTQIAGRLQANVPQYIKAHWHGS